MLPEGVELEVFESHLLSSIPPYNEDVEREGVPESVRILKEAIASSDAVLIATPEYNSSVPGQLKNALDWVSRPPAQTPMRGKPAAVIGASTSLFGAVWAQAEMRKVLGAMGARVVDRELPLPQADEALGRDGLTTDPDALRELGVIIEELLALAETEQQRQNTTRQKAGKSRSEDAVDKLDPPRHDVARDGPMMAQAR